jgi:hypothetical protein
VGRLNDHDMVTSCAEKVKETLFQQKALRQRCGLPKTSAPSAQVGVGKLRGMVLGTTLFNVSRASFPRTLVPLSVGTG